MPFFRKKERGHKMEIIENKSQRAMLVVSLSPEQRDEIKSMAKHVGCSMSTWARIILLDELKRSKRRTKNGN